MENVVIDGGPLTPEQVVAVAFGQAGVETSPDLDERLSPARRLVDEAVESGEVVYGITTGFGALATTHIGKTDSEALQYNLLRSHAAGVGEPLPDEVVRAMLLLRARTLAQGHSGVRPVVVRKLVEILQSGSLPVVPSQGSVGASGDLAPFAHLALPIIGEGAVRKDGKIVPGSESGVEPVKLLTKEGLSLLNGTEGMAAMGAIALHHARNLLVAADVAAALTIEALLGSARPFRPEIHSLRPHPGQMASAGRIAGLLEGSEIIASHSDDFDHAVQDAYSLRCAPQVHGAVADAVDYLRRVLEIEMGSVVDNPIVFADTGEVLSGGNFHGEPLALAADFAAIALSELASISERRTDRILDPARSAGLPPFLASSPGVESGYMITQYVQAALVASGAAKSVGEASGEVGALATDLRHLTAKVDAELDDMGQQVDATLSETRQAASSLKRTADGLEVLVGDVRQPLSDFGATGLYEFTQLVGETRQLIAALTRITKEFERDPAGFLLGSSQRGFEAE